MKQPLPKIDGFSTKLMWRSDRLNDRNFTPWVIAHADETMLTNESLDIAFRAAMVAGKITDVELCGSQFVDFLEETLGYWCLFSVEPIIWTLPVDALCPQGQYSDSDAVLVETNAAVDAIRCPVNRTCSVESTPVATDDDAEKAVQDSQASARGWGLDDIYDKLSERAIPDAAPHTWAQIAVLVVKHDNWQRYLPAASTEAGHDLIDQAIDAIVEVEKIVTLHATEAQEAA